MIGTRSHAKRLAIAFAAVACAAAAWIWRSSPGEPRSYPVVSEERLYDIIAEGEDGPASYAQWIRSEETAAFPVPRGVASEIPAANYAAASDEASVQVRYDAERGADVIDWTNADGWLEWEVEAPSDGMYELIVDYAPLPGSYSHVVRGILVDGAYPFLEAERLAFERMWEDGKVPYERNSIDNEIRPVQVEAKGWIAKRVSDHSLSPEPLRFALTQGKHSIRLVGVKEPVSLHSLTLSSPEPIPTYEEYVMTRPPADEDERAGWHAWIEAERFARKSAAGIRTISVSEPYASPDPKGRIVYNAIGGAYWLTAGDAIQWEFTVPETGYYAIDLKYFQGYNGNANAYRTIKIDGGVPFKELLRYKFEANREMELKPLSDSAGEPYSFYLTEGKHVLEMTVDNSVVRPVIQAIASLNERLSSVERTVRVVSGNYGYGGVVNLDTARVWEMNKYDPELEPKLRQSRDDLATVSAYLKGLYQGTTEATTALDAAAGRIGELLEDVDDLPNEVAAFQQIKSNLNAWTQSIEDQPMHMDYLIVRTPGTDPGAKLPNAWDKIRYSAVNFARTFFQTYDTIEDDDPEALTVWVQRGRDHVDLLEAMIEREFTPSTGIRVDVNLIPNQNVLLMSAAAGQQPDVALGAGMEVPADFAMRGAAQDLTAFVGFERVAERFNPGVMRAFAYDGGVYGLPETLTYNMLFVRTDILSELGLEAPDTWEDVLDLLPTLQENGMTFMFPRISTLQESGAAFMTRKPDFLTPYYQRGGEFYTSDGLLPRLNDEAGYAAFKEWTDWYAKYDLPRDVPEFFNHFRFGGIPVGVGDVSMYIQLAAAAPELAGHWKMLPIPGVEQPDGTVARWSSQGLASAMILNDSDRKEDAWKFLEWWTSDDVQSRYGRDIESFAGITYRWHTANRNALQTLPWEEDDLTAINEQWKWAKNMPFVPGYYMLPREMDFAWNDTLLNGTPAREALDDAQMALTREMLRKQNEFGIGPDDDLEIPLYENPYIKE